MFQISLYILLPLCVFFFFFSYADEHGLLKKGRGMKLPVSYLAVFLFFLALLLRILLAYVNAGHSYDMSCFYGWSELAFQDGLSNFYTSEAFTDYPPGYVYFLYVIGFLRHLFGITGTEGIGRVLIKLPAILFDLAAAGLIYHVAKKHLSELGALLACGVYLFHPAILLNSAIWGQVDSVFTFFVLCMCVSITEKKMIPAYYVFGIGLLIKPQMLFFGPILIIGIIDHVLLKDFSWKRFYLHLGTGLGAIVMMVLLSVPFGVQEVVAQYLDTISSYPYASVNGYNFWTMLGFNWKPEAEMFLFLSCKGWRNLFLFLVIGLVFFIRYVLWRKKMRPSGYFLLSALLIGGIFCFSTHMHERYLYPIVGLLLFAYIYETKRETLYLWTGFSYVHYMNVAHVLYFYDSSHFSSKAPVPIFLSLLTVACYVWMVRLLLRKKEDSALQTNSDSELIKKTAETENRGNFAGYRKTERRKEQKKRRIFCMHPVKRAGKRDFLIIAGIMVVYSVIAFHDLGDTKSIESFYRVEEAGQQIELQFEQPVRIQKMVSYLGGYERRSFEVELSGDGVNYRSAGTVLFDHVYSWQMDTVEYAEAEYIRLVSDDRKFILGELLFFDEEGKLCTPKNAEEYPELFDEQEIWQGQITYKNSTIFDEIYHARTAYEYLNDMYSYENTHPPLGKILIAAGIQLFGMNPFGWRFVGTLFGVLMIPVFYLLARRLVRDQKVIACLATILFTFDFMHFTQTRIATIDVFVTFFNLLSFYFMAVYLSTEPYTSKWWKQLLPLGLSGVSMGLAIASKWTGIYSACGLAVVFFVSVGFRIREYVIAKKDIEGEFDGISCRRICETFWGYLWKTGLFCVGAFILVPALIYLLSYLPFEDGVTEGLLPKLIRNQQTMWNYHRNLEATHYYSSSWYQWPVIYKPILYYSRQAGSNLVEGISAMGNPLVWWVGIGAFVSMVYRVFSYKDKSAAFLLIAFLAQFLPWVLVSRLTFIYHYFPSVPFLTLMIGVSMNEILKRNRKMLTGLVVYVALAVVLFVMFYPVISGHAVNAEYGDRFLRWFDSWVLFINR